MKALSSKTNTPKSIGTVNKVISSKYFFYLLPLVYLLSFLAIKGKSSPSGYYLIHYLYNYDKGFIPRGLIGEVISLFTDSVSDELITNINLIAGIFLAVFASLCFGRALNKVKTDKRLLCYAGAIALVIIILPASFSMYFESIHLDKFLWILTLLAVFLSDFKIGIWFAPALCIVSTLINPIYVFGSMILIAIILLQKCYQSSFKAKNVIICLVSYSAIIIIALYGAYHEQNHKLFETPGELVDFYFSRYAGELSKDVYDKFVNEWLFDYFASAKEMLKLTFEYYFKDWGFGQKTFFGSIFLGIPIWWFFTKIWIGAIKAEEKKFQKFIYFLCMISPVVIIPVLIFGWEFPRYFYDNILVQLGLLLFFVANKHIGVLTGISSLLDFFKQTPLIAISYVLYFSYIIVS